MTNEIQNGRLEEKGIGEHRVIAIGTRLLDIRAAAIQLAEDSRIVVALVDSTQQALQKGQKIRELSCDELKGLRSAT